MRVLALASYPVESAATRFRVHQLLPALAQRGIDVDLAPFLDGPAYADLYDRRRVVSTSAAMSHGLARRMRDLSALRRYDVVLVQREAMLAGPPVFEALITGAAKLPMVLDLDDATWVGYESPTYGRLARLAKWPRKTLALIDRAAVVTCGATAIVEFVEQRGASARLVRPAIDTEQFRPQVRPQVRPGDRRAQPGDGRLVVGWIGTHSTWQYLEPLIPLLRSVHADVAFRLRVTGAGVRSIDGGGLPVSNQEWSLRREAEDFASLDIGLYPLRDDPWARGKAGLKSVQYLSCGVPFLASPIGGAAEIGEAGITHLHATNAAEWRDQLHRLLTDATLRDRMSAAGRAYALAHHTLDQAASCMADALLEAVG